MAKLILYCNPAENPFADCVQILVTEDGPIPRKIVDIARKADAEREFAAYKADVAATGKPAAVSMRIARGDRSPPGFKDLRGARLYETVNL